MIFNPSDLPARLAKHPVFPGIIFSGPEGMGKATLALWWHQWLNCASLANNEPCLKCRTCRLIGARSYADLIVLAPAEEGGSLKIDQVRDMQQRLLYSKVEARWRMVLMEQAETLSEAAANCLLKILEEPPDETVFVLCTTNHFRLPSTVVSRCRLHKLLPVETADLARWLNRPDAELLARLSQGAPGKALALASDKTGMAFRQSVLDAFESISRGSSSVDAAEALDRTGGGGTRDRLMRLLENGATWYRDLMLLAIGGEAGSVINCDRMESLRGLAAPESRERWQSGVQVLAEARRHIQSNVNGKLLLQWLASHLTQ